MEQSPLHPKILGYCSRSWHTISLCGLYQNTEQYHNDLKISSKSSDSYRSQQYNCQLYKGSCAETSPSLSHSMVLPESYAHFILMIAPANHNVTNTVDLLCAYAPIYLLNKAVSCSTFIHTFCFSKSRI